MWPKHILQVFMGTTNVCACVCLDCLHFFLIRLKRRDRLNAETISIDYLRIARSAEVDQNGFYVAVTRIVHFCRPI